jgi:hypothetical protein
VIRRTVHVICNRRARIVNSQQNAAGLFGHRHVVLSTNNPGPTAGNVLLVARGPGNWCLDALGVRLTAPEVPHT